MKNALQLTLLAVVCAACPASRPAVPPVFPPLDPAAEAREFSPLPVMAVASADGRVRTAVESSPPATITWNPYTQMYVLRAGLGQAGLLECLLSPQGLAAALGASYLEFITKKGATYRRFTHVDAGAIEGEPYLTFEVTTDGRRKHKLWLVDVGEGYVLCDHEGIGYHASVRRVVGGLVGSLEYPKLSLRAPVERQTFVLADPGGTRFGVRWARMFVAPSGSRFEQIGTILLASDTTPAHVAWSLDSRTSDALGDVIRIDASTGDAARPPRHPHHRLERGSATRYVLQPVSGNREPAPDTAATDLTTGTPLLDVWELRRGRREALTDLGGSGRVMEAIWLGTEPARIREVEVQRVGPVEGGEYPVRMATPGEPDWCGTMTATGVLTKHWTCSGAGTTVTLVHAEGTPR